MVVACAAFGAAQPAADIGALATVIADGSAAAETRLDAAQRLVALGDRGEARARLRELLASPETRSPVLRAIAQAVRPPAGLEELVLALAVDADGLRALAAYRTPRAARRILDVAVEDEALREPALQAIRELSGRDLGLDPAAWSRWFAEVEHLPEAQWQRVLVEGFAGRSARRAAEREALARRLVEALERIFRAATAEARPGLLASMLRDDVAEVRLLGFRLTTAELDDGRPLSPDVLQAGLDLLMHPDPAVRVRAGILVDRTAPAGAGLAVLRALTQEMQPAPAAALLKAAARFPSPALAAEAYRWLPAQGDAGHAAIEVLLALQRAGMLEDGERVIGLLLERGPESVTPAAAELLLELGGAAGYDLVARALHAQSAPARLAAAEALWRRPEALDAVTSAARGDPRLTDTAARAIQRHDATASGLLRLAGLSFASEDARRGAIAELSRRLGAAELVSLCQREGLDAATVELILASLIEQDRLQSWPEDPSESQALADAAMMLAAARIESFQPELALGALRWVGAVPDLFDLGRVAHLRLVALLMLGRIDEAGAMEEARGGAEGILAWTEGLRRSRGLPHAQRIVARAKQFAWGDAGSEELAAWQAEVAAAISDPEGSGAGAEPR